MEELELVGDSGVLGNIKEDLGVLAGLSLTKVGNGELSTFDLALEFAA
jgi:hypothetical protein